MGRRGRLQVVWEDLRLLMRVYQGDTGALDSSGTGPGSTLTVVLGAQVRAGGVPSRTLAARARHAGGMYARGEKQRFVVSGGIGEHPPSEAEAMAGILENCGVPESEILREAASHSTRQSARHVAVLARGMGISEVTVVTDPLHCVRAVSAFRDEGLIARAEPVTGSPMWLEVGERRAQFLRELGAVIWYRLWVPSG